MARIEHCGTELVTGYSDDSALLILTLNLLFDRSELIHFKRLPLIL